jgi:hypothetical protein
MRPVVGDTLEVNDTVPVNPATAPTAIVDAARALAFTVTLAGLAEMVKFGATATSHVIVAVLCDNVPLVPVTVTV